MEETREGEVLSAKGTEKASVLLSAPEEVFIHDTSSDLVLMLEVISETGIFGVIFIPVYACWLVRTAELTTLCDVGFMESGVWVMVVSVGSVIGWAEGLVLVPVDISGVTVDTLKIMVVSSLAEVTSVSSVHVVVSVGR